MDVQFPNGQVTYVSGEGLSTSAFLPLCGGLLQAQGQYPGEMKFSFSCKVQLQLPVKTYFPELITLARVVYLSISGAFCLSFGILILILNLMQNKWGTRITPTWQWPDKSFALGLEQALAWKRSGLMVRPTVQLR